MPFLLAFAALVYAHPAPGHHHHPSARSPGDLEVEGALNQFGLPAQYAARMVTSWTLGIEAPAPSRAAYRHHAWGFDDTTVRVLHQRLLDAEILAADVATTQNPERPTCMTLGRAPTGPVDLLVLDPRARQRGPGEEEVMQRRLAVTWVDAPEQRTALLRLDPGEHATVIELVPDPSTPPRKRAHKRRRVHLSTSAVDWVMHDSEGVSEVCVVLRPSGSVNPP
jgi:hypothetical protein